MVDVLSTEQAKKYFGTEVPPGTYEFEFIFEGYFKTYPFYYKQTKESFKVKVVNADEYDHGNGD